EPAQTPATQPADSWSIGYGYTRTFTPALVNELRFTWTRQTSDQESTMARDEIVPGALDPHVPSSIPTFAVTGYAAIGGEPSNIGNNPSLRSEGIYNFSDNVSWSKGRHLLQTGFDSQIVRLTSLSALNGRGSFTFNGVYTQNPQNRPGTGSPVADLLLGTAEAVTTGTIAQAAEREHNVGMYIQDRWAITPRLTLTAGLRYELFFPPVEVNNQLANFILDAGDPLYGTLVLAGTQGKSRSLLQVDKKDLGPRIGLAWRVPGIKGLVIRSAYGIFYAQDEGTGLTNRLTNNPPFVGLGAQSIVSDQLLPSSGFILSQGSLPRPAPISPQTYVLLPSYTGTLRSWDQRDLTPYVEEWNFSAQKQLPGNMLFELNYVGNLGLHLLTSSNPNQPLIPGPGSPNARRPLAQYTGGSVIFISPANRSSYEGMSTRVQKQFSNGFSLLTSFTYGHSLDWQNEALDVCDSCPSGDAFPNSYNLKSNRGNSDNDVRLRYVFSGIWSLPFGPHRRFLPSGFAGAIARDWSASTIWAIQTGTWSSVALSFDNTNVGSTSRPDRICSGGLPNPTTAEYFNTGCFVTPPQYTYGNAGRNIIENPGVFNIDLMLARSFPLPFPTEGSRLQFRSEFFNLPNHPMWGQPGVTVGTPTFGTIASTAQPNRQMQFALRLVF
ncbi:MAG TPA: TonB-dependent receptor, partial [Bryobacteraceae bacterium]|nr:TonB-dependent receptor [Bryobacteraceae bacterium]